MRTIEKTVYLFSELSDDAKENAREGYRLAAADDNYFSESVINAAVYMGAIMGIEINHKTWPNSYGFSGKTPAVYWSGFSNQGDGACFEGFYSYAKNAVKKIAYETGNDKTLVDIAKSLQEIQRRNFYGLRADITKSGRYYHSGTIRAGVSDRNGNEVNAKIEADLVECFRDFANWIYSNLEKEYEYSMSNEAVDEAITCNEYEFLDNGEKA